jgi:hypothetical protein
MIRHRRRSAVCTYKCSIADPTRHLRQKDAAAPTTAADDCPCAGPLRGLRGSRRASIIHGHERALAGRERDDVSAASWLVQVLRTLVEPERSRDSTGTVKHGQIGTDGNEQERIGTNRCSRASSHNVGQTGTVGSTCCVKSSN